MWKIGADKLADKLGCPISSVYNTVMLLKKTDTFIFARLANNGAGKYIIINKLNPNFRKTMREVLKLSFKEIMDIVPLLDTNNSKEKSDNKAQFKCLRHSLKLDR